MVQAPVVSGFILWTFGVLLPLAAIAFEAGTAICVDAGIDPMPSPAYLLLLLTVPMCNVLAWLGLRREAFEHRFAFAAMTGFSGAIALFYAILFLPLTPILLIGVIVLLPALGLAPALGFWTSVRLARVWARLAGIRALICGAVCGIGALVLLAAPAIAVRAASGMIASDRSWVRETGFYLMRLDAVRGELSRASDFRAPADARQTVAWITGRGPLAQEEARRLYYRASGKSFDQTPVSRWRRRAWLQFDQNRGSDRVGAVTKAVRLASSRIDGSVDGRSAVGYFEWTMVFHNSSATQQEARMEMALPAQGVVSRATLWIHGAEHEAVFGERGKVRQAYEQVVRVRRDPLLVTTSGRDRVMVQCFPIEPGSDMKIRIGITAPVLPGGLSDRGVVSLPQIRSRNFDAGDPASVWIESKAAIDSARLREDGVYAMRGSLAPEVTSVARVSGLRWEPVWATDQGSRVVEQRFVERAADVPQRALVVVDGSESLRDTRGEIGAALATIPAGIDSRVVVASREGVSDWAASGKWLGGVDPVPAIADAVHRAGDVPRTAVLWIAGDQPIGLSGTEILRQALEREQGRIRLLVAGGGSSNMVLRDLDGLANVEIVPRLGNVADDVRSLFAGWRASRERVAERRVLAVGEKASGMEQGSPHIVRLWAAEESAAMAARNRAAAMELAVAHGIVTPLSGAVVLESAAQYAQNLLPSAPSSPVPTMPEPETVGLLAVGAVALAFLARRRARTA